MHELLFRGQTRKKGQKVYMNGKPVDGNWEYGGIFQGQGCYSVLYTYDPIAKKLYIPTLSGNTQALPMKTVPESLKMTF